MNLLDIDLQLRIIISGAIVAIAYIVDFLCCRLIVPAIRKIASKTSFKWDDHITADGVLRNAFHLIPPVTFQTVLPILFPEQTQWTDILSKVFSIYIIAIVCRLVCAFISSLYAISSETETLRNKPLKGLYQMLKVIVVCVCVILTIGILIEKDFTTLLAGLGASAAVLMLVFRDTILGLVAGVQLSAHDMLRPGDWIIMEKHNVNGTVMEVSLNTVKIRNWDNTITTIPPYILVSDSLQNWRGMRESGGRRVARSIRIDMNSIRFCTPTELESFSEKDWAKGMDLNAGTVNLTAFRSAAEHYLHSLAGINSDLMLMVRQLEPTPEGLPIQFYFFTKEKDWIPYEHLAAEVMEHIIASLQQFGLRVFQRPSGMDITGSANAIPASGRAVHSERSSAEAAPLAL